MTRSLLKGNKKNIKNKYILNKEKNVNIILIILFIIIPLFIDLFIILLFTELIINGCINNINNKGYIKKIIRLLL